MRLTLTIKANPSKEGVACADLISTMYELWAIRHSVAQSWWMGDDGQTHKLTFDGDERLLTCLSINEAGTHRMVRTSPFDAQGRRHTTFVHVFSDLKTESGDWDEEPNPLIRSYTFHPYRLVKCANGKEATDIDAVLAGELEALWD